jgi:hypothetical protein
MAGRGSIEINPKWYRRLFRSVAANISNEDEAIRQIARPGGHHYVQAFRLKVVAHAPRHAFPARL